MSEFWFNNIPEFREVLTSWVEAACAVSDPALVLEPDVAVSLVAAAELPDPLPDPKLFPDEFATGQWLW